MPALTNGMCVRRYGDESREMCFRVIRGRVCRVGLGGVCVKLAGLGSMMGCVLELDERVGWEGFHREL